MKKFYLLFISFLLTLTSCADLSLENLFGDSASSSDTSSDSTSEPIYISNKPYLEAPFQLGEVREIEFSNTAYNVAVLKMIRGKIRLVATSGIAYVYSDRPQITFNNYGEDTIVLYDKDYNFLDYVYVSCPDPNLNIEPDIVYTNSLSEVCDLNTYPQQSRIFEMHNLTVVSLGPNMGDNTPNKYGNLWVQDSFNTIVYVYKSSATLFFSFDPSTQSYYENMSYDFLDNPMTNQITLNSVISMAFIVQPYNGNIQLRARITSVTPIQ